MTATEVLAEWREYQTLGPIPPEPVELQFGPKPFKREVRWWITLTATKRKAPDTENPLPPLNESGSISDDERAEWRRRQHLFESYRLAEEALLLVVIPVRKGYRQLALARRDQVKRWDALRAYVRGDRDRWVYVWLWEQPEKYLADWVELIVACGMQRKKCPK